MSYFRVKIFRNAGFAIGLYFPFLAIHKERTYDIDNNSFCNWCHYPGILIRFKGHKPKGIWQFKDIVFAYWIRHDEKKCLKDEQINY